MSTSFIFLTDDDVMDLGVGGDEARGRGGAHIGGGQLGQEHQDIDQVRPA